MTLTQRQTVSSLLERQTKFVSFGYEAPDDLRRVFTVSQLSLTDRVDILLARLLWQSTLTLNDNASAIRRQELTGSLSLLDTWQALANINLTDDLTLSDVVSSRLIESIVSTVGFSDVLTLIAQLTLENSVGFSDEFVAASQLAVESNLALSDTIAFTPVIAQTDAVSFADTFSPILQLGLTDSLSLSDSSTATEIAPPLLDTYSGAVAAYALVLLRSAYFGPLIEIRRASDGALEDIYPTASGALDESAILSFVGSGSATVRTWYDQSGNGKDFQQTTVGAQPPICNSGIIVKINGMPALTLAGDSLNGGTLAQADFLGSGYECTAVFVLQQNAAAAFNTIFAVGSDASPRYLFHISYSNTLFFDSGNASTRRVSVAQPSGWDDAQHTVVCQSDGSDALIRVDNTELVSSGVSGTPTLASHAATIGGVTGFSGYVQCIILYEDAAHSAAALDSAVNDIYSVY